MASAPVFAADNPVISLGKTAYTPGEQMSVTVTGITAAMESAKAFVSIQKQNERADSYGSPWKYVKDLYVSNGVWTVNAPTTVGDYEIRFYSKDGDYANSLALQIPFKVVYDNTGGGISITPDKTQYTLNEGMKVTVSGFTEAMESVGAFVSIAEKDDRPENYGSQYEYVKNLYKSKGVWTTNAPKTAGEYEIRFYAKDGDYKNSLTKSVTISVVYATAPVDIKPDKNPVRPGDTLKITVTGITEAQKSVNAFVSIAKRNDRPENYGSLYKYIKDLDSTSGVWTVEAPKIVGDYEIRVYAYDGKHDDSLVAKADLTVSDNASAVVPTPSATPPPGTTPTATPPATGNTGASGSVGSVGALNAETVDTGILLSWKPMSGALGYRVYRSRTSGQEGMSITDFMITGTNYVDVNVDELTTYYYTLRAVLKEADAATGERETLSEPSAEVSAKTGAILGGNASDLPVGTTKNFILMTIDNPMMSVNGIEMDIDPPDEGEPPRNTKPIVVNGRTVVPIRVIVETMGGKVGWDGPTKEITMKTADHTVVMWIDKKDLEVDGQTKEMDIAPFELNGRTLVPVRFVAENIGCVIDWISKTQQIVIVYYTGGSAPAGSETAPPAGT